MNQYDTAHSTVQRRGNQYVEIPRSITTGERIKETIFSSIQLPAVAQSITGTHFLMPIFNVFKIDQGSAADQRLANSIFIHRVELDFCLKANQLTTDISPESTGVNTLNSITDPRIRILVVQPKRMMQYIPVDATNNYQGTYPFYSSSANVNYPQTLSPPVPQTGDTNFGMLGFPDVKTFDVEYDDIKNVYENSTFPIMKFSQQFIIRKKYNYTKGAINLPTDLEFNDKEVFDSLPLIWVYVPLQISPNASVQNYTAHIGVRMIYD